MRRMTAGEGAPRGRVASSPATRAAVRGLASPVAGAIFDCDGTLLDTMPLWHAVEEGLARQAGHELTPAERDALCTYTILETGRFFHEGLGLGASAEDVVRMIEDAAVARYASDVRPRPGALAFVRALSEAGVRCAVASSSPHSMLGPGLAAAGLAPYIEAVVSTDDVGAPKREPAAYDRARRLLGTPLEATWVFEDAAYALRTARAAGYRAVGIWDCDLSGTFDELCALADVAVRRWSDLDPARFLAGAYARR